MFSPSTTLYSSLISYSQYFFVQCLWGSLTYMLCVNTTFHFVAFTFEPNVGRSLMLFSLLLMHSHQLLALQYLILRLDTCTLGRNIPLSVHVLYAPPALSIDMFHCWKYFLSHNTHFLLYIITFICLWKNKKIREGKEYYLILEVVMSPLNIAQTFESTCHPKFGFSMILGSWSHYLEFTPPTSYSSSPSLIGGSCITKFHYQVYAARVRRMFDALIQRISISLCWPFLITLDFSCRTYP